MTQLSSEQQAIIDAVKSTDANLLIRARAGSGKTFSLLKTLPHLKGTIGLLAFNKAIAQELEARAESSLDFATRVNLNIGTVHAFGLRAYKAGLGKGKFPKVQGGKVNFLIKDNLNTDALRTYFRRGTSIIGRMVGAAKNSGFGLTNSPELFPSIDDDEAWIELLAHFNWDIELEEAGIAQERAIALAQKVLLQSNQREALIDFDDMVYLPLLRNFTLPTFNNVLIDEAQDISATRRELAFRSLVPGGRMIAVGDDRQAIYGFTGADANSLSNIGKRAVATTLPLTTCWRCDADIIAEAQKKVPDIKARADAPAGKVASISFSAIEDCLTQKLPAEKIQDFQDRLPQPGDAILCRLNKPNVSMALTFIRAGIPARIEGRDIGAKLLGHIKTADSSYAFHSLQELIINLEDYGQEQCTKLASLDRAGQAALLEDEISAAVLLLERALEQGGTDFSSVEWLIQELFDDNIPAAQVITLSSVHKSKGREWPRVFILGRFDYMPFRLAKADWEKDQEHNLIYVAITRAEHELIYITDVQSALDKRKKNG